MFLIVLFKIFFLNFKIKKIILKFYYIVWIGMIWIFLREIDIGSILSLFYY